MAGTSSDGTDDVPPAGQPAGPARPPWWVPAVAGLAIVLLLGLGWSHTRTPWAGDGSSDVPAGCDPDRSVDRGMLQVQVSWTDCCNDFESTWQRRWWGWEHTSRFGTLAGCIEGA